jgi:nucleotide-binding universal stress UspA family protein
MVSVDLEPEADNRIKLAADLAGRFSSRLIGVAAQDILPPLYFAYPVEGIPSPADLSERNAKAALAKAEALFRRDASAAKSTEWRSAVRAPLAHLLEQARAADLIVVGRSMSSGSNSDPMRVDAGDLVMDAGRPILVVPPKVDRLPARRVLIGWKDTRESRRAVWDSLALLGQAEEVFVVAVDSHDAGAKDVSAYLSQHGIAASHYVRPHPAGSAADELTKIAEQEGADLIVCGAYGHSRASEWVFGGVTRDLLHRAPVCCLLAH